MNPPSRWNFSGWITRKIMMTVNIRKEDARTCIQKKYESKSCGGWRFNSAAITGVRMRKNFLQ